ncbi:MAG: phosphoribosylamine--glycine ligase, partial [Actinobacteria bacterium]|nr:phosphoribosylamine--glycine ligase [Actinomycetota bacterium]
MKILVLGAGAREHAIIKALIRTGTAPENISCAPGNGGISQEVTCIALNPNDPTAVTNWATEHPTDLVIIG